MITSPGKLFKLSFAVKGWTAITDLNFKRLNSVLLYVPGIGDVQTSGALQDRDILVWNASTQKWVVTHFYDYFATTTTTTSSSSSTTTTTTSDAVFPSGWTYKKSMILSRASGSVSNYQMKLTVNRSSGTDGDGVVYVGTDCAADYKDLRFTKSDGSTLLDYYIESYDANSATVWIEFDSIGTGSTTFYMYYGNSGASAASNGANTFIYFQDFNSLTDGDLNGQDSWSGSTAFDVQTSVKYEGAKAVKIEDGGVTVTIGRSISVISYNMFIQMHLYSTDVSNQVSAGFYIAEGATPISGVYIDSSYIKHLISPAAWQNVVAASSSQWHKIRMAFDSASTHKLWTDDVLRTPLSNANLSNVVSQIDTIRLEQYSNTSSIGYFDQVFIGQYLATEPAWGSWGSRENV